MGRARSTTSRAATSSSLITDRPPGLEAPPFPALLRVAPVAATVVDSDTGELLRAEQPGGTEHQHRDHHDEGDDGTEPAAQEQQLILVPGGEGLGDPDQQPADQGAPDGVQTSQ